MKRIVSSISRKRAVLGAFVTALTLSACMDQQPTEPGSPLIPPTPPNNPQILSAAWKMDVFRTTRSVTITPPTKGLEQTDLQILADYFGIEPGSPDLSILAGDVITIEIQPGSFASSAVGAFVPGQVRTTFGVAVHNKLSGVNIITPTFPAPPAGEDGVILFPFQITVTETPGGATVGGDGTDVLVELPNLGLVAPSVDWNVAPHNFFNDDGCPAGANDCYRSETFQPLIQGLATSAFSTIGFDHDPTVNQFRVRMIVAGDLEDAIPNQLPTADAGGPYTGTIGGAAVTLTGAGSSDPDGTIASYAWDFDNDAQYDDATGVSPAFTCTAPAGPKSVGLQVTDNRSGTATATTTVTCNAPANQAPVAEAGGPYSGVIGGAAVSLSGAGSSDDGSITLYEWDLDNDGQYDDATGVSASFTCTAPAGAKTIGLRVTDNGAPALTGTDAGTVNCAAAAPTTIRGRWVDGSGNPISSTTNGSTVFFEIDIQMAAGENIHDFQAVLQWSSSLLTAATPGTDLNCSGTGGQASCPSGSTAGNVADVLNQYTGNNANPGEVNFLNFSNNPTLNAGTGIQGLGRLQFTAIAAGTVSPSLVLSFVADGAGSEFTPAVSALPSLTIN